MLELEGREIIKNQTKLSQEDDKKESTDKESYINLLSLITTHKWHCEITLMVQDKKFSIIALIDSRAKTNCIQEGLIPTKFYEKTTERVTSANGSKMNIQYKLSNAKICKNKICYTTSFVLIKNMNTQLILGTPFLTLLYPSQVTEKGVVLKALEKEILFEFIKPPRLRELNLLQESSITKVNVIERK